MSNNTKPSGIEWIGDIPADWETGRLKYFTVSANTGEAISKEYWDNDGEYLLYTAGQMPIRSTFNEFPINLMTSERDILVARNGAGAVQIPQLGSIYTDHVIRFILKKESCINFIYYSLLLGMEKIVSEAIDVSLKTLSRSEWDNLTLPFPSVTEQKSIAAFLDAQCSKIDNIITELEQQIEILKQYKTSLITETVTKGLNKATPMKDSGIDWIGKIPSHWEVKRLKYLGSAKNGLTYAPENISDEGILVFRSSNIQDGKLSFEDNIYVDMEIPKEIVVRENDILICSRNGSRELIGKCALIDNKIAGNTYGAFMCVFRSPYNRFIHYVFQSNLFTYYLGNYLTSTINQLTNANLYSMKIPITFDENEQLQIVTYLDNHISRIDYLISEKQQSIDTMKAYKKSLIYEFVTGKKRVEGYS